MRSLRFKEPLVVMRNLQSEPGNRGAGGTIADDKKHRHAALAPLDCCKVPKLGQVTEK
jgi:hypothetical protein